MQEHIIVTAGRGMKGHFARMCSRQFRAHSGGDEIIASAMIEGETSLGVLADSGERLAIIKAVHVQVAERPAEHLAAHVRHACER